LSEIPQREETQALVEKNASALAVAQIVKVPLSLLAMGLLGRVLGPSGLGRLMYALAIIGILRIFMDWGTSGVIIREVSQHRTQAGSLLQKIVIFNGVSTILTATIGTIIVYHLVGDSTQVKLWVVCLAFAASDTFCDIFRSFFRGYERMELEAFVLVIERIGLALFVVGLLFFGGNVVGAAVCYLMASVLRALVSVFLLRKVVVAEADSPRSFYWLFKEAVPFALRRGFGVTLGRIPIIMLARFQAGHVVGLYGAAERLFEGAKLLPYAIAESAYPSFSRTKTEKSSEITSQVSTTLILSVGAAIVVATICFVMAEPAIGLIYGAEFAAAGTYLSVVVWALPLMAVGWTCCSLLQAVNRQGTAAIVLGLSAAVQVAVCAAVARQAWGGVGICFSWIVTGVVMALTSYWVVLKSVPQLSVGKHLVRLAISGAVLVVLGAAYRHLGFVPSLALLVLSTAAYSYWNGLITPESLQRLAATWRRSLGRDHPV